MSDMSWVMVIIAVWVGWYVFRLLLAGIIQQHYKNAENREVRRWAREYKRSKFEKGDE